MYIGRTLISEFTNFHGRKLEINIKTNVRLFQNHSYRFMWKIKWGEAQENDFLCFYHLTSIKTNEKKPNLKRDGWFLIKVGDFILSECENKLRTVKHLVDGNQATFFESDATDMRTIAAQINEKAIELYEGLLHEKERDSPTRGMK